LYKFKKIFAIKKIYEKYNNKTYKILTLHNVINYNNFIKG